MKKVLSVLFSLVLVIGIAFTFGGCGEEEEEIEKGFFYTVKDAYGKGLITHEQAMSIAYYHNGGIEYNEEIMDENYTPLPIMPEKLSEKKEISLRLTPYMGYSKPDYSELQGIRIDRYYGMYNGCIAVMMSTDNISIGQKEWRERFDDIEIHYNDSNRIYIWRKADDPVEVRGQLSTMEKAYAYGWLNEDDLKSIACRDYEYSPYEENPYSGMFTSTEELTEEMETEIKQAYLEQVVLFSEGDILKVKITHYYGTYNGNVVVSISSGYIAYDLLLQTKSIGGVIFKDYAEVFFLVYHIS